MVVATEVVDRRLVSREIVMVMAFSTVGVIAAILVFSQVICAGAPAVLGSCRTYARFH